MVYPKISIITPSLNQGKYIEQTILSVLTQNYPNLEYIIIDGGSTDNTVEVIKKYEKYLYYWESIADRGQSHAINKGLAKATGDIFNWLNSDDYLAEGYLLKIGKAFYEMDIQCFCGITYAFHEDKNLKNYPLKPIIHSSVEENMAFPRHSQPATFYRKSVFDSFGGLNETLHYCMDREFWIKFHMNYPQKSIYFYEDIGVYFRLHQASKTVEQINNFIEERKMIEIDILTALQADNKIIKFISNITKNNYYKKIKKWNINHINKKKYIKFIAKKYLEENKQKLSLFDFLYLYFTKIINSI